eukprot:TRINITY_DN7503_c1_g1_i2.p1 TRINITY_DN7503_c1_g1~~TRINITY_DN7503_c1_g1_i2.p1  ORF type:complete len:402 (-),score=78.06 TRINITY_DN7503_c1_g1_i2:501-1706(-)
MNPAQRPNTKSCLSDKYFEGAQLFDRLRVTTPLVHIERQPAQQDKIKTQVLGDREVMSALTRPIYRNSSFGDDKSPILNPMGQILPTTTKDKQGQVIPAQLRSVKTMKSPIEPYQETTKSPTTDPILYEHSPHEPSSPQNIHEPPTSKSKVELPNINRMEANKTRHNPTFTHAQSMQVAKPSSMQTEIHDLGRDLTPPPSRSDFHTPSPISMDRASLERSQAESPVLSRISPESPLSRMLLRSVSPSMYEDDGMKDEEFNHSKKTSSPPRQGLRQRSVSPVNRRSSFSRVFTESTGKEIITVQDLHEIRNQKPQNLIHGHPTNLITALRRKKHPQSRTSSDLQSGFRPLPRNSVRLHVEGSPIYELPPQCDPDRVVTVFSSTPRRSSCGSVSGNYPHVYTE